MLYITSRKPVLWTGMRKRITLKEHFRGVYKEYEIQLFYGTGVKNLRDCKIKPVKVKVVSPKPDRLTSIYLFIYIWGSIKYSKIMLDRFNRQWTKILQSLFIIAMFCYIIHFYSHLVHSTIETIKMADEHLSMFE